MVLLGSGLKFKIFIIHILSPLVLMLKVKCSSAFAKHINENETR
jgi:hypothetical protein